jgi:hypothetical protein
MAAEREVDAVIRAASGAVQPMFEQACALIKSAAPHAEEKISYGNGLLRVPRACCASRLVRLT